MATPEPYDPNCCACNGTCCHVGPHSYCERHGGRSEGIRLQPQPVQGAPLGWVCPQCGRAWAPHVAGCICHNVTVVGRTDSAAGVTQTYTGTTDYRVGG